MSERLVQLMKQAAVEAVDRDNPCAVLFGTVTSVRPLEITIEQKLKLKANKLILSSLVREFALDMTVDHHTENEHTALDLTHSHAFAGDTSSAGEDSHTHHYSTRTDPDGKKDLTHRHDYKGRKKFLVHLGLTAGEKVILLRVQGGKQYVVLDRVR